MSLKLQRSAGRKESQIKYRDTIRESHKSRVLMVVVGETRWGRGRYSLKTIWTFQCLYLFWALIHCCVVLKGQVFLQTGTLTKYSVYVPTWLSAGFIFGSDQLYSKGTICNKCTVLNHSMTIIRPVQVRTSVFVLAQCWRCPMPISKPQVARNAAFVFILCPQPGNPGRRRRRWFSLCYI